MRNKQKSEADDCMMGVGTLGERVSIFFFIFLIIVFN